MLPPIVRLYNARALVNTKFGAHVADLPSHFALSTMDNDKSPCAATFCAPRKPQFTRAMFHAAAIHTSSNGAKRHSMRASTNSTNPNQSRPNRRNPALHRSSLACAQLCLGNSQIAFGGRAEDLGEGTPQHLGLRRVTRAGLGAATNWRG